MVTLLRTDSENVDFIGMVKQLDEHLAILDGADHSFYDQFNKIGKIKFVVVAYEDKTAIGCGALKASSSDAMEVKRMYVSPEKRGQGIATLILNELEKWTSELSFGKCVLETGKRQPEAIQLYEKNGYIRIPNYGQYIGMENSVCFEKQLFSTNQI